MFKEIAWCCNYTCRRGNIGKTLVIASLYMNRYPLYKYYNFAANNYTAQECCYINDELYYHSGDKIYRRDAHGETEILADGLDYANYLTANNKYLYFEHAGMIYWMDLETKSVKNSTVASHVSETALDNSNLFINQTFAANHMELLLFDADNMMNGCINLTDKLFGDTEENGFIIKSDEQGYKYLFSAERGGIISVKDKYGSIVFSSLNNNNDTDHVIDWSDTKIYFVGGHNPEIITVYDLSGNVINNIELPDNFHASAQNILIDGEKICCLIQQVGETGGNWGNYNLPYSQISKDAIICINKTDDSYEVLFEIDKNEGRIAALYGDDVICVRKNGEIHAISLISGQKRSIDKIKKFREMTFEHSGKYILAKECSKFGEKCWHSVIELDKRIGD